MEKQTATAERKYLVKTDVLDHEGLPVPDIEIERIDFFVTAGGVIVNKMGQNIYNKLIVADGKTVKEFDLEAALHWCEQHGWKVRRWPGGARAWVNELTPVRTKLEIIRLRDQLKLYPRPELEGQAHALDLAYDL